MDLKFVPCTLTRKVLDPCFFPTLEVRMTNPSRTQERNDAIGAIEVTGETMKLSPNMEAQIRQQVADALTVHPVEGTYVEHRFKTPTLLARADATVLDPQLTTCPDTGDLVLDGSAAALYEAEIRPAGAESLAKTDPVFASKLARLRSQKSWPNHVVVISPGHGGLDTHLGPHQTLTLEEYLAIEEAQRPPVLARVRPSELTADSRWNELLPRSVGPLDENKSYGCLLGWWNCVSYEHHELLPWASSFVLKPLRGSWAEDVVVWSPGNRKIGHTKSRIKAALKRHGMMVCQPYQPPIATGDSEHPHMILRVFYGWRLGGQPEPAINRIMPLGGVTLARAHVVVHGATDTRVGLLHVG